MKLEINERAFRHIVATGLAIVFVTYTGTHIYNNVFAAFEADGNEKQSYEFVYREAYRSRDIFVNGEEITYGAWSDWTSTEITATKDKEVEVKLEQCYLPVEDEKKLTK